MKSAFGLVVLAATLVVGTRHNDWAKPCFNGECAYDLPEHKGQSGAVKFFAKSPSAIADITPAAGWVILDCDPNVLSQDIRLVCKSDDVEGAGCNHFFEGAGPVDKYVRLPESCASSPFARISKFWTHADQSIPSHHQVTRRDGVVPQVFAISIDDKFDEIDDSKHGDVHYVAYGLTAPEIDINLAIPDDIATESVADAFLNEAIQSMIDAADGFKFTKVTAKLTEYYVHKPDAHPPAIQLPTAGAGEQLTKHNHTNTIKFGSESDSWSSFEIKSEDLQCQLGPASGGLTITGTVNTYFWGTLNYGAALVGKGGKTTKFLGFMVGLESHLKHEIGLSIALTGKFAFEHETTPMGIPGVTALEFGIAKIGLLGSLKIEGNINAEASAEFTGEVQYGLHQGVVTFPGSTKLEPYFNPGKFDAKFSADKKAKAGAEIALTPKLILGSAATKTASAGAFVGFEGKLALEVEAKAPLIGKRSIDNGSSPLALPENVARDIQASAVADSDAFCATAKLSLDGHVGGELKFVGLGPSLKHSFWKYELELASWGGGCDKKSKRHSLVRKRAHPFLLKLKDKLTCPTAPLSKAVQVVKDAVLDPKKFKVLKRG